MTRITSLLTRLVAGRLLSLEAESNTLSAQFKFYLGFDGRVIFVRRRHSARPVLLTYLSVNIR